MFSVGHAPSTTTDEHTTHTDTYKSDKSTGNIVLGTAPAIGNLDIIKTHAYTCI